MQEVGDLQGGHDTGSLPPPSSFHSPLTSLTKGINQILTDLEVYLLVSGEETVNMSQKDVSMSYGNAVAQDQLLKLQSQVQSLSTKQLQLVQEKERD